jgi:stage V sporulation protein S
MDRFFSKLDLRDIKIDPDRSRFSPDEEFVDGNTTGKSQIDDFASATNSHDSDSATAELSAADWVEPTSADLLPTGLATETAVLDPVESPHSGDILKVSSKSRPSAVAGAIAGVVREMGHAEVQAIGAGATNQAIKAVAIARDYLRETGIDAVCLPEFIDIIIDNEDRTAIRLVIEPR